MIKKTITTMLVLVLVLGAMPIVVMAMPGVNAPGTVGVGVTAIVADDITGNIIVDGGTLILDDDFTITGMVTVRNEGTFHMSDGRITGGGNRAVYVIGNDSTFNMSGGIISGNSIYQVLGTAEQASAVLVNHGAHFEMTGGYIQDNIGFAGTVRVVTNSTFNMSGDAVIRRNSIPINLSGLAAGGGGINIQADSTVHISGGHIYDNHAAVNSGGILVTSNSTLIMSGGIIEKNRAGSFAGVSVTSGATFNMSGGEILGNIATNDGGGVGVTSNSTFNMSDSALIYDNQANGTGITRGGGGIFVGNGTLNMSGGIIKNNRARTGGGIRVTDDDYSSVTITSGSITNNIAFDFGGGIWTANYSNLTIYDTVQFSGNTANAPHDFGAANRGVSVIVPAVYSGGGNGGNPQNIDWATVSIPGSHALNNFDINYSGIPTFIIPNPDINKTLRMPNGTAVPNATFNFNVSLVEVNGGSNNLPTLTGFTTSPSIPFNPSMTSDAAISLSTTNLFITGTADICFENVTWPFPGVYVFRVTEIVGSGVTAPDIMIYDPSVFYIYVYVGRLTDSLFAPFGVLQYYTVVRIPSDDDCDDCLGSSRCSTCYHSKGDIEFENRFIAGGSLEVEKEVTGDGNRNRYFDFDIVLTLPSLIPASHRQTTVTAIITGYVRDEGVITSVRETVSTITIPVVVCVNGIATAMLNPFQLRHGDRIEFTNVPIGTTYVLTETHVTGYEHSAVVRTGGVPGIRIEQDTPTSDLVVDNALVGQTVNNEGIINSINDVLVTNEGLERVPPMGVLLGNVPFVLMVALGVGALGITTTAVIVSSKIRAKR